MWDVLLIAIIVALFVVAAIVVHLLDGMIARAGTDADPGDEDPESQPGGLAR